MRITFVVNNHIVVVHMRGVPDRPCIIRTVAATEFHLSHNDCAFYDILLVKGGEAGPRSHHWQVLYGIDSDRCCRRPMGTLTLAMPALMRFPPHFKGFWLPAVVGELKPNRCMGINYRFPIPCTRQVHGHPPQVFPPVHSDHRLPHCLC